jgi:hypothetical protein
MTYPIRYGRDLVQGKAWKDTDATLTSIGGYNICAWHNLQITALIGLRSAELQDQRKFALPSEQTITNV